MCLLCQAEQLNKVQADRARALGARTVLVGATQETGNGTMHIRGLAELPALLQQIA